VAAAAPDEMGNDSAFDRHRVVRERDVRLGDHDRPPEPRVGARPEPPPREGTS